jgi:hypothetical protein
MSVILACFVVLGLGIDSGFAYIADNGSGTGYKEGDPPDGSDSIASSQVIESYIETGAGHYLKTKEAVGALLDMVEKQDTQGIDLEMMTTTVDNALTEMGLSIDAYNALITKAESTPYNEMVIGKLNTFDYNGFMLENGLNDVILGQVEAYLKNGDITGIFKRKIPIFNGIVSALQAVKADLDNGNAPGLTGLWNMNDTFSEMSLFGSYVARIFHSID